MFPYCPCWKDPESPNLNTFYMTLNNAFKKGEALFFFINKGG